VTTGTWVTPFRRSNEQDPDPLDDDGGAPCTRTAAPPGLWGTSRHYLPSDSDVALRIRQHLALSRGPLSDSGVPAEAQPPEFPAEGAVPRPLPSQSHVARAIVSTSLQMDSSMRRASAGYVDLKLLLPVLFAAASSFMMRSGQGTPMWMTLAVSAFNSFLSLHPAGSPGSGGDAPRVPAA